MIDTTVIHAQTPIGTLRIIGNDRGVSRICFTDEKAEDDRLLTHAVSECARQITEYFERKRTRFDSLHLAYPASDFQKQVWDSAMNVPFGETVTYADIAQDIGNPKAARAVGSALNANPLLLIIPCHRIVPASGSRLNSGGFAAGTWRKDWLLDHEEQATSSEEHG